MLFLKKNRFFARILSLPVPLQFKFQLFFCLIGSSQFLVYKLIFVGYAALINNLHYCTDQTLRLSQSLGLPQIVIDNNHIDENHMSNV